MASYGWFHVTDCSYPVTQKFTRHHTDKIPEKLFEAEIFQSLGEKHLNLKDRKQQDKLYSLSFGYFFYLVEESSSLDIFNRLKQSTV